MSTVVLIDVQKQGRSVIIRSARKSFKADSNGPSHQRRLIADANRYIESGEKYRVPDEYIEIDLKVARAVLEEAKKNAKAAENNAKVAEAKVVEAEKEIACRQEAFNYVRKGNRSELLNSTKPKPKKR